jgi:hypothetical protein
MRPVRLSLAGFLFARYDGGMLQIPPDKFTRDAMASLPIDQRARRIRELESLINPHLQQCTTLDGFQKALYSIVDQLNELGHFLGRWDYSCEVEYWGGKSYMDQSLADELLLRSEFPVGLRLVWGDFEQFDSPSAH